MHDSEQIRQLKQLIKQTHPDVDHDGDSLARRTAITQDLLRRLAEARQSDAGREPPTGAEAKPGDNTDAADDPAYATYRRGLDHYRRIRSTRETGDDMLHAFDAADRCFSTVVTEFADSPWAEDAVDKRTLLRRLRGVYLSGTTPPPAHLTPAARARYMREMGLRFEG